MRFYPDFSSLLLSTLYLGLLEVSLLSIWPESPVSLNLLSQSLLPLALAALLWLLILRRLTLPNYGFWLLLLNGGLLGLIMLEDLVQILGR